jgi:hypothetical protein
MSNTPDLATCLATDEGRGELLSLSPFTSLHYHFGMLLGVDDFETEQAYHRAKMRLHNAWLHREGVVWGFGVNLDAEYGEIHVAPGMALDAAGHELHLEADACVNVGEWFDRHEKDPDFVVETDGERKKFDVHVVIRFKACLTRQVPALLEPCDNANTGTAYSRVFETLEILLLPNRAQPRVYPYHLLRLLFGLDEPKRKEGSTTENTPEDQAVLDEVKRIQALPGAQQAASWLEAFHRFAALDEMALQPAKSEDGARTLLFPGRDDDPVLLADITGLTLIKKNGGWVLSGGTVDTAVRPSHVATTTIQDLLCGSLPVAPAAVAGDSGPRVEPGSVILLTSKAIMFRVDKELHDASVKPAAFSVTWFDPEKGWQKANILDASYGGGETQTVSLELKSAVSGRVRLIASGTGPTPLLGADLVPLAGAVGGPPATPHDGHDFV